MKLLKLAAAMPLLMLSVGSYAAVGAFGEPEFARNIFSTPDKIFLSGNAGITAIAADSANNMYLTTNNSGLMAVTVSGESFKRISTSFPANNNRYPGEYLLSDALSAITFASFGGNEYFFFSSADTAGNAGVQWGRFTDRFQFEDRIALKAGANAEAAKDIPVNALAYEPVNNIIYAASEEGLVEIELDEDTGPSVSRVDPYTLSSTRPDLNRIWRVTNATEFNAGIPAMAFITKEVSGEDQTGKNIYLFTPGQTNPISTVGQPLPLARLAAIKDIDGELWYAQKGVDTGISASSRLRRLGKYINSSGTFQKVSVADFEPPQGYYTNDSFQVNDFTFDPSTGALWLATTGRAFYQIPDTGGFYSSRVCDPGDWTDPSDDFYRGDNSSCAYPGGGWRPIIKNDNLTEGVPNSTPHLYFTAMSDSGGNVWLGSSLGIRGFISRYMALSATRYIGVNSIAEVNLDDVNPGAAPYISITVGSNTVQQPILLDSEGKLTLYFGFTYDEELTLSPLTFPVTSTPDGVDITVEYYKDINDILDNLPPTLRAAATWAEILDFEDDLFIGGPCFLETLGCVE
ncbi:MAG: hypothetical protein C0609_10515 [Deltaproteobacteria bacterium]|nr:MAG: hypothetical protein C0609_10515 [Deltaproteobacteria bacterium]